MSQTKSTSYWGHGWIDSMAIGLSVLCAVHCLLTPVLLVLFPVIASTFWVERDFQLWMLFCVLPTTCIAIFLGCQLRSLDCFPEWAGVEFAGGRCCLRDVHTCAAERGCACAVSALCSP